MLKSFLKLFSDNPNDTFTKRDFIIVISILSVLFLVFSSFSLMFDKVSCAYKGHIYERNTKRPIFAECLIQMKDGSYIPLERYINKVLTINDMNDSM